MLFRSLIVMMVWMGVYSQTFLVRVGRITNGILEQTNVNVPYRVQLTPLVGQASWPVPPEVARAR